MNTVAEIEQAAARQKSEADFQQIVQKYQAANDKSGLEAARNGFQSVAQDGGSHAGDARRYLSEINSKLAAMKQEIAPPPQQPATKVEVPATKVDERPAVSNLIQQYAQAFEQRDADALRKIWPTMGNKYEAFKNSFGMASAYHVTIQIDDVKVGDDGQQATVDASLALEYTPRRGKPTSHRDKAKFQLAKSNGVWTIQDVR